MRRGFLRGLLGQRGGRRGGHAALADGEAAVKAGHDAGAAGGAAAARNHGDRGGKGESGERGAHAGLSGNTKGGTTDRNRTCIERLGGARSIH